MQRKSSARRSGLPIVLVAARNSDSSKPGFVNFAQIGQSCFCFLPMVRLSRRHTKSVGESFCSAGILPSETNDDAHVLPRNRVILLLAFVACNLGGWTLLESKSRQPARNAA